MSKPPIFYSVAQVRFNPILGMPKFVGEIQDRLRSEFPDFRQEQMHNLQLKTISGEIPEIQTQSTDRWLFIDSHKTSGYILQADSLIFHTTAYDTSESLFRSVLSGIKVVHACIRLSYIESVGVRTLDAVVPEEGDGLESYLSPHVLGIFRSLEGLLRQSITETVMDVPPNGRLISRVVILRGALGIPVNLAPLSLELAPRLLDVNSEHAVLDNDRIEQARFAFDLDEIQRRLGIVKRGATEAFYKSTTPAALAKWK